VLAFRVLSGYGMGHLTIRDGSDISSPVILKVDYEYRWTIKNPFATVVTTQERIRIDLYVNSASYETDIKFEILSVMPGKLVFQKSNFHQLHVIIFLIRTKYLQLPLQESCSHPIAESVF